MKPILSTVCAAAMVLSIGVPAHGGPMMPQPQFVPSSNLINVQGTDYSGSHRGMRLPRQVQRPPRGEPGMRQIRRGERRAWRGDRRGWRGERHARRDRGRIVRRGDAYYWRGYRGSRYHRPGYRRYGDWWFPGAAFLGGAIVGNIIASQPRATYGLSSAHVDWCYGRYRSYRATDNTFQPYHGPRKPCYSPYGP